MTGHQQNRAFAEETCQIAKESAERFSNADRFVLPRRLDTLYHAVEEE